jgi:hypothetical protein
MVLIRELGHARIGFTSGKRLDLGLSPTGRGWKQFRAERRFAGAQPLAAGDVAWLTGSIVRLRSFTAAIARWLGSSRCAAALAFGGRRAPPFALEIAWSR